MQNYQWGNDMMVGCRSTAIRFGVVLSLACLYSSISLAAMPVGKTGAFLKPVHSQTLWHIAESDDDCDASEDCSDAGKQTSSPKKKAKKEKHGASTGGEDCDAGEDCSEDSD
jgi:hypothetical protein